MMCENCGKNEATFYYKSNVNGQVSEQHLCSECAKKLGYTDSMSRSFANFGAMNRSLFGGFDDFFAPVPALAGNFFEPFENLFGEMDSMFPQLGSSAQTIEAAPQVGNTCQTEACSREGNDLVSDAEHQKFDKERRINALRCEMQQAIQTENFERAAVLRDQLHGLEQNG